MMSIFLMKLSTAACLVGYNAVPSYPGPAKKTVKIWNEKLFTAQVMRILLNDVFQQDVEFFTSSADLDQVITDMAGLEKGLDSKDAVYWNLISEVSLSELRNNSQYGSKFLVLPLGSGALVDLYKVIHPGLSLNLPYIAHLLMLVNFASDEIDEGYFITYDTAALAYNASCEWLRQNIDLVTLWTPWIELKDMKTFVIHCFGALLIIISTLSFLIIWFLLWGNDIRKSVVSRISHSTLNLSDLSDAEDDAITAKRWIRAGDVKSLDFIFAGCLLSSILAFLAKRESDIECNTYVFIMHGGVLIVIGSLTARTQKLLSIYKVARGDSLHTNISFWSTWFAWVILPSLLVFLYLVLCLVLIPLKSTWFIYGESFYRECALSDENFMVSNDGFISMEKFIVGIPSIIEGLLALRLIYQLWNLDGLEDQYNEQSQILCVLLILGLSLVTATIVEIITMNPYTKDTFQIGLLYIWYYSVQAFMFWPRIWRAYMKRKIGDGFIKKEHVQETEVIRSLGTERSRTDTESKSVSL